jgi:hypothetical protein
MTPWILGFPLVVLALVVAALVWEKHRERVARFLDEMADQVRETLEDIGRLPFVILLALALAVPAAPAQAGIRIDIPQLVEAILTSDFLDVGGVAPSAVEPGSGVIPGAGPHKAPPTPVAQEQEVSGPPHQPPAPAATNEQIVRAVFHEEPDRAVEIFTCESGLRTTAKRGQHLGIAQMGQAERDRFGHGDDAQTQVEAAKDYYETSGWRPWRACW